MTLKLLVPAIALGVALCTGQALAQRAGSYQQSCSGWDMDGDQIVAACPDAAGTLRAARIDPRGCAGDIANVNGTLVCRGGGGPPAAAPRAAPPPQAPPRAAAPPQQAPRQEQRQEFRDDRRDRRDDGRGRDFYGERRDRGGYDDRRLDRGGDGRRYEDCRRRYQDEDDDFDDPPPRRRFDNRW